MVEPISTTAAATATATTATTATSTTASVAVPAGAIASDTAAQAAVIRRLASAMIYSGETQILNQSEIIDEFATPIYAGIAAATPTPAGGKNIPGNKILADANGGDSMLSGKINAANGETAISSAEAALPGNQNIELPQPQTPIANKNLERPEIQQLLDNYYQAPTIEKQLESDAEKIIIERTLIDDKVIINGDNKTAICWIEERVIDRKYLDHGHLSDLISEIRHGNIPSIRQIYLAIIDLTDLATLKLFRSSLMKYKLEDAKVQLRQISADLEKKTLQDKLPQFEQSSYKIDRQVKKRSWFKTDKVTERIGHKDVENTKQTDLVVVNVRDVCSVEMSRNDMNDIMSSRQELENLIGANNTVNRIESTFSPEQIASINKSAMMWTQERFITATAEYTADHEFVRYGVDLDGFLGEKITETDKQISVSERKVFSEYLSKTDNINLDNINTYEDAITKISKMEKTATLATDPQLIEKYTEVGTGTRFEEGWITYLPAGSIVNLGVKLDLGAKITGWDYFWAGVDVAAIALLAVTLGTSAAASGGVAAGKVVAATAGKTVLKGVAKATGKVALKQGAKAGAKAVAKQTAKVALKQGAKAGAKAGSKASAKEATKIATKTGFKPNARYIKNGFTYLTDKQGRVVKATGKLKNIKGIRNPQNQRIAAQMGKLGDEGGHLIPANYGGSGSLINHVPQARNVNRSVIKRIENEMGRALKAGKNVDYTVMPHYPNATTLRPDKFTIRYVIDGVQKIRRVSNV